MELHIHNSLTNQAVASVSLDSGPVTLGRAADNVVRLESPLLAGRHAMFYSAEGRYFLDGQAATNPIKVNGKPVVRGQPIEVTASDDIQLGEFQLGLVAPAEDGRLGLVAIDPNSPASKALAFEEGVHDRLLSALNLQTASVSDRRNPEYVTRIDKALLEIIRDRLSSLEVTTGDHFISAYLKRRLAAEVANSAERRGGRGPTPAQLAARDTYDRNYKAAMPGADAMEAALGTVVTTLSGKMALHQSRLTAGRRLARDKVLDDMHTLDEKFESALKEVVPTLTPDARRHMITYMVGKDIHDILFGYGPLEDLLRMPDVEEIMVLNEDQIYVGKEGRVEATGRRFFSRKVVISIIERIVGEIGRKIDFREPMVDARLPDGSRVNAIIPPVAVSGPTLTIRRFPESRYTMADLVSIGSLTESTARFLRACVEGKKNILVSGGTGTGKTTLLNVLASYIGRDERVVTIEDAAELNLPQKHVVTLEARPAGLEGTGAVSIEMLLKNALRMRPDRIIVGECRGAEAVEMLQAMNTGHEGSLTTLHANDTAEAVQRLETMVLKAGLEMPTRAIREQISSALDVIVQISRLADGRRSVTRISEVTGMDHQQGTVILQDIFFRPVAADGDPKLALQHTGYVPGFIEELFERKLLRIEDLLVA